VKVGARDHGPQTNVVPPRRSNSPTTPCMAPVFHAMQTHQLTGAVKTALFARVASNASSRPTSTPRHPVRAGTTSTGGAYPHPSCNEAGLINTQRVLSHLRKSSEEASSTRNSLCQPAHAAVSTCTATIQCSSISL
jgi:hypothetical protein